MMINEMSDLTASYFSCQEAGRTGKYNGYYIIDIINYGNIFSSQIYPRTRSVTFFDFPRGFLSNSFGLMVSVHHYRYHHVSLASFGACCTLF